VSPARFSVKQVVLVNLLFVMLMLAGMMAARNIPVDVFPDISFNSALLITVWPGASPSEVERLVTSKIEEEARSVNGIKEWWSFSTQGSSSIQISWKESLTAAEQQAAVADLRAAIERVEDLPDDAEKTILREMSVSEVFEICMVAVRDVGGLGEFALRDVARDLQNQLERISGVRKATLRNARDREVRVYVDKNRALQYDLTLPEIAAIIKSNNQNIPGGTFSDSSDHEITVRGMGNYSSPEQIAATVVKKSPDGNHIALGEVAEVVSGFARRTRYGYVNGVPAITLAISKTAGSDISNVVDQVRGVIEAQKPMLPAGLELDLIWDSSDFVARRIQVLRDNLAVGIALVVLILWLTIGFRNSMLAIIGVPFSFLTALVMFPMLGLTINMLSLVGFVMVSGMLVDDAIIVIENIYRHIEAGESLAEAAVHGTEEVMWPVISATCTTMAAFIPMLLISGTSGEFMEILPKTVIVCLVASLIECLFILPAHYLGFGVSKTAASLVAAGENGLGGFRGMSLRARGRVDRSIARLRELYLRGLDAVLPHRVPFLVLCMAAFYFSCGLSARIPVNLFPSDFNQLFITVKAPTDYSIDQTNALVLKVQDHLAPLLPEIEDVTTYTGFGMTADEMPVHGSNYGTIYLSFPNSRANMADPGQVLRRVREHFADFRAEGLESLLILPPRNGPSIGKPVAVRIQTEDYALAKLISSEMQRALSVMPGVFNVEDNMPEGRRELRIGLDEHRASIHGLSFGQIGSALLAANEGMVPSTFKDPMSDEDIDIRVLPRESQRRSAADLLDVNVRTPAGYTVKIRDVATVDLERGYQRLYHYDAQRTVVVYADVDNLQATSTSVNSDLAHQLADIPDRYPGVSLVFGGEFEDTNETMQQMGQAFLLAIFAIYAILAAQFRSYLQPLVVMCVIALAWIGVVLGMTLWGYVLSMYVIYAMVGLAGIVVNDSLILIDFINKQRELGVPPAEAARIAGSRRFRAILLTTLTTVAGLLPMAMGISGASPVFGPFAAAIVAGLLVASGLTLFVVPSLYLVLEDAKTRFSRSADPPGFPATVPVAGGR
jgi:HAE1 family hydrophobic/amphiphilic exporter-1